MSLSNYDYQTMREALFYKKLADNKIGCELCHQSCQIMPGKRGLCGVRENLDGTLATLVYGKVIAANVDPIEKKPLYHFLPGSQAFSIATVGCNFSCANCQNADISQAPKEKSKILPPISGSDVTAEQIVSLALKSNCQSIAYTYTEPTIFFEFALDCMKLAVKNGLKNIWVSNGYTSQAALEMAKPYLAAVNIDLKFFSEKNYQKICGAKLQPVLDNLIWYKKNNIWLEVTTLLIPTLNEGSDELTKIAKFIKDKLGADTPWHVSAFHPVYKLTKVPPTLTADLKKAWQIGKAVGLHYVYGGNIFGQGLEDTNCSQCGQTVIARSGYQVKRFDQNGQCQKCDAKISGNL
ncbi:MAG: AmmeMemoRadiSam system radical SAM enzyme [Patescibacteria group bacterium]